MLDELQSLEACRPDTPPPHDGYTVLVRPRVSPDDFIEAFREVWRAIARWGRWSDSELGDWPADEEFLSSLPHTFRLALEARWSDNISNWIYSLHDRDWILWSLASCEDKVKIDLDSEGMPISSFGVELVAEALGAEVIECDLWHIVIGRMKK